MRNSSPGEPSQQNLTKPGVYQRRSIVVDHDSIPGFMMPMVMPFNVKNIDAVKGLNFNDSIHFKFTITNNSSYAHDFVVVGSRSNEIDEDDFWDDDEYKEKKIGEEISNVTLINLDGKEVKLDQFEDCLLYTSPSPRDMRRSRMPSSA